MTIFMDKYDHEEWPEGTVFKKRVGGCYLASEKVGGQYPRPLILPLCEF